MTIGQVAKASGLSASAIRFYEKEGLLPQPVRSSGQRRYDRKVLERLALLEFAKECGFALSEARTLLNASADDAPLSERLRGVAQRKIAELDAKAQPRHARPDYTFNTEASFRYFAEKRLGLIRLPLQWERLQPIPQGPLDASYLANIKR